MKILLLIFIGLILVFLLNFTSGCTVVCNEPYIQVGSDCCLDKNSNNICDDDEKIEEETEEPELIVTESIEKEPEVLVIEPTEPTISKGTSLPPAAYIGSRYVPRTVSQTTPQYETRPSFFWSTPYYSEPPIKGYWVSIDSETEWTLVTPPTWKRWTSRDEIVDGTHTFRIRTEYGDGRFGEAASVYFSINTKLPDIAVGEITLEQSLFRDGNSPIYKVIVSTVIKNDASKDFIGADNLPVTAISIYLHVDGAWRTTANSLQNLFAGEEKKITFKPIYLPVGEYELQVILDQSDTIKETDETNNEKMVMINVG